MPAHLSAVAKAEMNDMAVSVIILCLGDKVLREVARETSAVLMWTKLGS
ncbi:ubiquitin-protein ligase, partial [Trifolium medium]|nr:ubiquitin-protein ligase [Trifolium medium]